MQNFAEQIIESQEKLLAKTIEEQRKLDQEMFNQYNNIFLQQTQMLLAGLQNLSSPFPDNYPILQPFSGVSTMPPMFTETSFNQSCPIQPTISHQNNKNIIYPNTSHETQTRPKTHQTEKSISKFTTIPPPNSVRPKTIQPLIQNASTISQNETLSSPMRKNEDTDVKEEEDIEYENIEYLENLNDAKN